MGTWREAHWAPEESSGLSRADRRGGGYRTYVPNQLCGLPIVFSPEVDQLLARAERAVRALRGGPDLAGIARFLLRSEAIASSRIEGITPTARNVALAELGPEAARVTAQARLVANNMTVVRQATSRLVATASITVDDITQLHAQLLREQPQLHGIRQVQNWIGGSTHNPIGAQFVPPAPDEVPGLMADLVAYLNGATHAPIVQAALVHAQFETIHPFSDGNGRVGRALIHTVLTRRGLTSDAILPVSLILATFRDRYVTGLSGFRHEDSPGATEAACAQWIQLFAEVVLHSAEQAMELGQSLEALRVAWDERLSSYRQAKGAARSARADSALVGILGDLPSTPVLTPRTAAQIHSVSTTAALKALDELAAAGILTVKRLDRKISAYLADEVLDLVTLSERQLASTRFDTRLSPPVRPVP
ncbi:MAG: Fic family protein, partial [Propionibacteriaceae bacterium]|nr:Fic family protein [Propionibacteriaceae bacterium]